MEALREPVGLEALAAEDERISDLLFVEAANLEPAAVRRTAAWVSPLTEEVTEASTLGVVFELYDLPDAESTIPYSRQDHLEDANGARIPLYICPSGAHEFRMTWSRMSDAKVCVAEYVMLDLTEVEPGDYTLEIVAPLPRTLDPVRSRRSLIVRSGLR